MSDGPTTVGVAGPGEALSDALADAGLQAVTGTAAEVCGRAPDAVVAVGEAALLAVAAEAPDAPLLSVDGPPGAWSVPAADATAAVESLAAGEGSTTRHPVLSVTVDGEPVGTALLDVALMTAEPARISEYGVRAAGEQVADFRADGVVLSTPAGSPGYGRAAGAPVLAPETGVGAVTPVAPFATTDDHWVLPLPTVEFAVLRDEATVELQADGAVVATVEQGATVGVDPAATVDLLALPASRSPYRRS
jgi:NAD+ kinase